MTDEHQIEEIVERLLPLYTLSSELDSSSRDKALRKAFHLLTEGLDLSFRQDNVGNIYLTTPGQDPDFPPLGICFPLHSSASTASFEGALRVFLALQGHRLSCAISLIGWASIGNDWLGKEVWEGLVSSEEGYIRSSDLRQFASMPSSFTFPMSALFEIRMTSAEPMVIEGSPILVDMAVSAKTGSVQTSLQHQSFKRAPSVTIEGREAVCVGQSSVERYSKYIAALFDNFD